MEKSLRLEIETYDRVGMALDILKEVAKLDTNIASVEVFPNKVYIKTEKMIDSKINILKYNISKLPEVIDLKECRLMPSEENERKIFAVINSVDQGIVAINKNKEIEIFNSYCENIFNSKKQEVLGKKIDEILHIQDDAPILNLINNGEEYDNIKMKTTSYKNKQYITTGRSIKDDEGNILGAVASLRDINEVREMVDVIYNKDEDAFKGVIGNSRELQNLKDIIKMISKGNSTVLLRGESGTGKEVFAKAIHNLSDRKDKKMITINCAALPENLIESELFGYEEGSFTGAIKGGKIGLFKEANGGTIFLDEIGELSMILQAKLLRVIQEGKIRKIGSGKEENVDVRIITATNRDLENMIKNEKFREDLYYRLNVIPIYIPPIRERKEDIPLLVKFFIDKLNKKINKDIIGFDSEYINELMNYEWPGNVRELENVIERSMNLCNGKLLNTKNLMLNFRQNRAIYVKEYEEPVVNLQKAVENVEKNIINKTLSTSDSIRKAAKKLGISHTALINKIKKHNIKWKQK
ncbi:MAG TPA: sigma 54-interacting transcriptional regulator [Peptostreptococcaceae bacterium]|nr:sigma 54-interacting transcriptional regulator [Peptostreptococcaceae bacterium]